MSELAEVPPKSTGSKGRSLRDFMDPFLFTLQWEDLGIFDLTTGLSSIAIRDQMVRAMMLADHLPVWLEKEHGEDFKRWPILVIGAGVCGMTAAVTLARQGLSALVVDREQVPFFVQRRCTSRWLDPTQYDWPLDHWRRQCFRWRLDHREPPFPWYADRAHDIVRNQWVPRVRAHRRAVGNRLRFRGRTEADLDTIEFWLKRPRLLSLTLQNLKNRRRQPCGPFGAIVIAAGFGAEHSSLDGSPQFVGFPFWRADPFEMPACGLAGGKAHEGTVLISGTGDGALQDFLRVITRRRSVRAIFDDLGLGAVPFAVEEIYSTELRAEKALNWGRTRREPFAAPYLKEVHQTHVRLAQALADDPSIRASIYALAKNRPTQTILVNSRQIFACTYPLNRFLALLLIAAINDGTVQLLSAHELQRIQTNPASPPPTSPSAQNCLGHPWRVTLFDLNTNNPVEVDAKVIILRHGVPALHFADTAEKLLHDGPRPVPPTHLY